MLTSIYGQHSRHSSFGRNYILSKRWRYTDIYTLMSFVLKLECLEYVFIVR